MRADLPGGQELPCAADGFAAGAFLTFKADGATSAAAGRPGRPLRQLADPSTWFQPQPLQSNVGTLQLTAEDGAGGVAGPVPVKVGQPHGHRPSGTVKPHKKVKFRVFGFQTSKKIYLHIRRSGKTKGRVLAGHAPTRLRPRSKRMRFMPLRQLQDRHLRVLFSHSKKFSKKTAIGARSRSRARFSAASAQTTAAGAWG